LSEGTFLILHFQSGLTKQQELAVRLTTFLPLFLLAVVGVYLCSKTTSPNTAEKKEEKAD
jgi:predicted MPP superfamily phosphohydrolase